MTDPDDREDGFYWISIDGRAAEVAQWQAEWNAWLAMGRAQPLTDEHCVDLTVLGACLAPPQPARRPPAATHHKP